MRVIDYPSYLQLRDNAEVLEAMVMGTRFCVCATGPSSNCFAASA